ncbi:hypothetical protein CRYUN_Cryun15aG0039700 [Craigia yunnanensis]
MNNLEMLKKNGKVMMNDVAYVCWQIWKIRCKMVMERKHINIKEVSRRTKDAIKEFYKLKGNMNINCRENEKGSRSNADSWEKPMERYLKVNCDGAVDVRTKVVESGVIVKNSEGNVVDGVGKRRMADNAIMAKALSLRDEIELVIARKWQKVILEIDAKELQYVMTNKSQLINWRIRHLIVDIQRLLRLIPGWKIRIIKKVTNAAANWIAVQTKLGMCSPEWIRHHPSFLVGILDKDGIPAPP